MTIPHERTRAVRLTREFLADLASPKKTRRVPLHIRKRALALLKHYPTSFDMDHFNAGADDGDA